MKQKFYWKPKSRVQHADKDCPALNQHARVGLEQVVVEVDPLFKGLLPTCKVCGTGGK